MIAIIIDAKGVRPAPEPADVRRQGETSQFFWLDIFGGDADLKAAHLESLGLEAQDLAWAVRFGQTGRMQIGRDRVRVVTWMADPQGKLVEVHLIACGNKLLTVWSGDPSALDDLRRQFSERVCGYAGSVFHSAAILLQLLLGTLDSALLGIDLVLEELRLNIDSGAGAPDYTTLARRLHRLQSIAANFDRYAGAVRSATVGIETAPGMDASAAVELNDYVEQVEDVAAQFYERRRWMSDLMHDFSAAMAQRQGEQISRLTVVSMIFLPVTAITGFFGMNFDYLNRVIVSEESFVLFGLALPVASVLATFMWLWRGGLFRPLSKSNALDAVQETNVDRPTSFALDVDIVAPQARREGALR